MIYIYMDGRLGNQFFRYAFARQLQKHNPNETIIYNFDAIYRQHKKEGDGQENSLQWFKTIGTDHQDSVNYSIGQYVIWKLFNRFYPRNGSFYQKDKYERKWLPIMKFFGLYFLNLGYAKFPLKKPWWVKSLIVNGAFECEHYFDGIGEAMKEEFQPKFPLNEANVELLKVIKNTNSVAISVRRGDFVDDTRVRGTYFVCDKKYYEKAIEVIKSRVENPVSIFFSNDISWVKENIKIEGCQCYYESGVDPVWETMQLMSSCKHFIISNSTFHWWAQYVSDSPKKIVVAPSRWYNDEFKSALFQKNWTLINV